MTPAVDPAILEWDAAFGGYVKQMQFVVSGTRHTGDALSDKLDFVYYKDPSIESLYPSAGITEGGYNIMVRGRGFLRGSVAVCCFHGVEKRCSAGLWISTTLLRCAVPPSQHPQQALVEVSINGLDYSRGPARFVYLAAPTLSYVAPARASTLQTSPVTVTGAHFPLSAQMTARVGLRSEAIPTSVLSSTHFVCILPVLDAGNYSLQVSIDGVDVGLSMANVVVCLLLQCTLPSPVLLWLQEEHR